MFRSTLKYFFYIVTIVFISNILACTNGVIPIELIPEGYRAEQYEDQNPVLTNIAQVRVTPMGFDYVKDNIGNIIKGIMPDMYMEPDAEGNSRLRICVPPQYGAQAGFEYGVASTCDSGNCDVCGQASGSSGSVCANTSRCSNGAIGADLIITILKESVVIEPRDDGTNADFIYGSVSLAISDIPLWINGIFFSDSDDSHTVCAVEFPNNIPVSLNIDFVINTLNPAETSFDITNINYSIDGGDLNLDCTGFIDALINLVKGLIINQITPIIDEMINSLSETLLCSRTIPVNTNDLSMGFQCPLNAPANASPGLGCSASTDCSEGFNCEENLCKKDIACNLYDLEDPSTQSHRCTEGFCDKDSGKCIAAPFCMESENVCWKQKLGLDGKIDIMGIIGMFIETTSKSWVNFYLNLGDYAKKEGEGLSVGAIAGTSSEWNPCVSPSSKSFDKVIPEITMFNDNTLNGNPYHLGAGISEYFVNQLLDSAYNGGALCLDIDSKVSSMITTSLFGFLIPSINSLTSGEDSALMIAIRPKKSPLIKLGEGNTDGEGNIIINEALLNVKIDDLEIDFYAFLNDRYTKIFTAIIDLNLGVNLDVDAEGKLLPVLAPIKFGTVEEEATLNNLRIKNAEILRETHDEIANLLPGVVELALGLVPLGFDAIAIPSFMGFGIDIKDILRITEGSDEETKNFIGIFADILIGVELETKKITINSIDTENKIIPRIKSLRKGKQVSYSFKINTNLNNLEYQYRINKGFWTPFKKGSLVKVDNSILKLQGKYNIDFRAREIGNKKSLSKIMTKTIIVDAISPKVKITKIENKIKISAKDNISNNQNVKLMINLNNLGFKEYKNNTLIDMPKNMKIVSIVVKAIDESGNESIDKKKFNLENIINLNKIEESNEKTSSGCSYNSRSSSSEKSLFIVFLLALSILLLRKRNVKNLFLLLIASSTLFFYGCGSNAQSNNCKTNKDCDAGKFCVEEICITNKCEEGDESFECSDCYMATKCSDENPCNEGCECNPTLGSCSAIIGFCKADTDCEIGFECEDNTCKPKICQTDNDCSYMDCSGDHSKAICNSSGLCSCYSACSGGCPSDEFCCQATNHNQFDECLEIPDACHNIECQVGYDLQVTNEGSIDEENSCERVDVVCDCIEKPHLKLGTIGLFAKSAIWNDGETNKLIVVGYNSTYKDLVLGVYDKDTQTADGENITWSFIDGVLNDNETTAEVTHGPTGPRMGISQTGINVGQYSSVAVDSNNNIHIAYYDKEHKSLRYALVKKHVNDDETDDIPSTNKKWDIIITTVDEGSEDRDTGYYTSISLDNLGVPAITYMVNEFKDGLDIKSSLNIAVLQNDIWTKRVLDESVKDLPCNNSCGENQKCLFNEAAVTACENDLIDLNFNSSNNNLAILDNNINGISSSIEVPENTIANVFSISYKVSHNAVGHLKVVLVSPNAREYLIVNPVSDDNTANNPTPNGINAIEKRINSINDLNVSGLWTLKVIDNRAGTTGTLDNWSINIKQKRNNSPYCGASCQNISDNCAVTCSSMSNEICSSGLCKKEAKEVAVKFYLNAVGLFNKSQRFSGKETIGILYYDSINGDLKYIHYKTTDMTLVDNKIIDSGKSGKNANFSVINNIAHITYRDNAGNLRYLDYSPASIPESSILIDDGLRINNGLYSINKIGSDSLIVKTTGVNEYDIYYYDASDRNILKKHYNKDTNTLDEEATIFKDENDDNNYLGSFGFYLSHQKLNGEDIFPSFYYKTQVGKKTDADYLNTKEPDSSGKVKIIK